MKDMDSNSQNPVGNSKKSPLININKNINGKQESSLHQSNNNNVDPFKNQYVSDRIQKTLQKYSSNRLPLKGNNSFIGNTEISAEEKKLSYSNTKSQNNQFQHSSVNKIYNSTMGKVQYLGGGGQSAQGKKKIPVNTSPYLNDSLDNGSFIVESSKRHLKFEQDNGQNCGDLNQFQQIYVGNRKSSMKSYESKNYSGQKAGGGGSGGICDISFDSLNLINSSFTHGEDPFNNSTLLTNQASRNLERSAEKSSSIISIKQQLSKRKIMPPQVHQNDVQKVQILSHASNQNHFESSNSYNMNQVIRPNKNYQYNQSPSLKNKLVNQGHMAFQTYEHETLSHENSTLDAQKYNKQQKRQRSGQEQWVSSQLTFSNHELSYDPHIFGPDLEVLNNPLLNGSPLVTKTYENRQSNFNIVTNREISRFPDTSTSRINDNESTMTAPVVEDHPFKKPKLHHFKKDASRRIKTSSATRNLQPIVSLENRFNNFSSIKVENNKSVNDQPNINSSLQPLKVINSNILAQQPLILNDQNLKVNVKKQLLSNLQQPGKIQLRKIESQEIGQSFVYPQLTYQTQIHEQSSEDVHKKMNNMIQKITAFEQDQSPRGLLKNNMVNQNIVEHSTQEQEEINGFKHSFYNIQNNAQIKGTQSPTKNCVVTASNELLKFTNQEYSDLPINHKEADINQIFRLNVNQSCNKSLHESKTMTPCFLSTPNMTDKWNNFNPQNVDIGDMSQSTEPKSENFKQEDDGTTMKSEKIFAENKSIRIGVQKKKPMTSWKSKNQSQNNLAKLMSGQVYTIVNKFDGNSSEKKDAIKFSKELSPNDDGFSEMIDNMMPEDIYLVDQMKPSKSMPPRIQPQVSSQKPLTSGSSNRRPVSRNHPIVLGSNGKKQSNHVRTQQDLYHKRPIANEHWMKQFSTFVGNTQSSSSNDQQSQRIGGANITQFEQ